MQHLLQAAARNIEDARVAAISGETRFDAAYKCIMQCAMVALWANGYRTSTSQPGHHQTAIQTLPITIELDQSTVIVLDALRKQRNIQMVPKTSIRELRGRARGARGKVDPMSRTVFFRI